MPLVPSPLALVLGATGGVGGEVARRMKANGWQVRALHRDAAAMQAREPGFHWLQGDVMQAADVARAAHGASLIVHAVNPPGYRNWGTLVLPMLDNSIEAARQCGARILLPGTVYNFGADAFPAPTERSPQNPATRKGAVRAEMESRLARAAERDGVRSLVVRAGDYFGPRAGNNWFSQALVKPGRRVRTILNPGQVGVGHQWAYLPDVAETMVRLLNQEKVLAVCDSFHMAGHWDPTGTGMADMVRQVLAQAGQGDGVKIRVFPWWAMALAQPFMPLAREMQEMRYLWRTSLQMDNDRLRAVLGTEPHTPLQQAVRETLEGLGCLQSTGGTVVAA